MHFEIEHVTTYSYNRPVHLGPHVLRLNATAATAAGTCLEYSLRSIATEAIAAIKRARCEGNVVTRLWFSGETPEAAHRQQLPAGNPAGQPL